MLLSHATSVALNLVIDFGPTILLSVTAIVLVARLLLYKQAPKKNKWMVITALVLILLSLVIIVASTRLVRIGS